MMDSANALFRKAKDIGRINGLSGLARHLVPYLIRICLDFTRTVCSPSKDVLYISGCPGGSEFYRCLNQQEELGRFGIQSSVVSQHSLFLNFLVNKHKIFIFQRVIYNPRIALFLNKLKSKNKRVIFETDDLVFDPDFTKFMAYYHEMGMEERSWYDNGIGRELLEDNYFGHAVVSTDSLKHAVLSKYPDKKVFVSSNKLGMAQIKAAQKALKKKDALKPDDGKIRIGYFSGSKSHDRDFSVIENQLIDLLSRHRRLVLTIVGHLKLSRAFDRFGDRIEKFDFLPLDRYYQIMIRADINIAPLEIENPFCRAKSPLKFFEAALLEIPTIASATPPFKSAITHGKDGFIIPKTPQWTSCLERLIEDKNLCERIGQNAFQTAYSHYAIPSLSQASPFIYFIKQDLVTR